MKVSEQDYQEACNEYRGYCMKCKDFTADECEPDARNYECPECEHMTVYGAEESLLMGIIEIS